MTDRMILADHGAELCPGAGGGALAALEAAFAGLAPDRAGVRLHGIDALRPLLGSDGALGALAAARLGARARAVRAVLFDKSAETNWSLSWHQDRTICVKRRIDVAGFGRGRRKRASLMSLRLSNRWSA